MTNNNNNNNNNWGSSSYYLSHGKLYWYAMIAKGYAYKAAAKVLMGAASVLGMIALGIGKLMGIEGC